MVSCCELVTLPVSLLLNAPQSSSTMDGSIVKQLLQDEAVVGKIIETGRIFFTNSEFTINVFPLLLYTLVSLLLISPFLLNLFEAPADSYTAPAEDYGPPSSEYGAPEYRTPATTFSASSLLKRRDQMKAIEALERKLNAIQDIYYNSQPDLSPLENVDYDIL